MKNNIQLKRQIAQLIVLGLLFLGLIKIAMPVMAILLPASLLFGNFFCGWMCGFGAMQDIFGKLGDKLFKKKYKMPNSVQKYLQYSRYIIMTLLILGIGTTVIQTISANQTFKMSVMTNFVVGAALIIMVSFLIIAMFFERPFCNYVCTEGIKFSLLSTTRRYTIKRDEDKCVNCNKCDKVCPMNIIISDKERVKNIQCINCFKCVSGCPVNGALSYGKVEKKEDDKTKKSL